MEDKGCGMNTHSEKTACFVIEEIIMSNGMEEWHADEITGDFHRCATRIIALLSKYYRLMLSVSS